MNKKASAYIAMMLMFSMAVFIILGQRTTDADRINSVANGIASFELPPGYQTDYVVNIGDYTIAAYKSSDSQSHLGFAQVPAGVIPDDEVIKEHVYDSWSQQSQRHTNIVSTDQRFVLNQPATLTITEQTNGDGQLYRSAYLVFEGKNGTSVLVINQPIDQWDADLVEVFIASIH